MKPHFRVLPLLVLTSSSVAMASSFADPEAINRAVVRFTGMPTGSPGGAAQGVDRRLKLASCQAPLALGWYGSRREAVVVQCPDPAGWRVFVPILVTQGPGEAPAVLSGETVTVAIAGEGFTVSQPGEALESGAVGKWIRVKSSTSKGEVLRARVARPGLVRVDLDPAGNDLP